MFIFVAESDGLEFLSGDEEFDDSAEESFVLGIAYGELEGFVDEDTGVAGGG